MTGRAPPTSRPAHFPTLINISGTDAASELLRDKLYYSLAWPAAYEYLQCFSRDDTCRPLVCPSTCRISCRLGNTKRLYLLLILPDFGRDYLGFCYFRD